MIKNRLIKFLSHLGIGQKAFEKKVGISNGYVNNMGKSMGSKVLMKISKTYPELNTDWLLTGEGEMLKTSQSDKIVNKKNISGEKIREIREYFCKNNNIEFAKMLGENPNTTSNWIKRGISIDKAEIILTKLPKINRAWLLADTGTMLISTTKGIRQGNEGASTPTEHYNAPLLPISAMGGSLNEFSKSVMQYDVEQIVSPIKGVDFVISVSGDSMYPDYPNGCKVFIKKVNENLFLQWGEVYVLDTQNGVIIKRIKKSEKEGIIICESINPNYDAFKIDAKQVNGFYRVLLMMITR